MDDELVELLWNGGTIVAQGQSSCSNYNFKTTSGDTPFMPTPLRHETFAPLSTSRETNEKKALMNKDAGNILPKFLPFSSTDSMLAPDIFSSPTRQHDRDPERERDVDTDADTVPWIDYTILDKPDHCSEDELQSNFNPNPPLPHPSPSKPLDIQAQDPVQKSVQDDMCSNKKLPHLHLQRGGLGAGLMNFSHFLRPVALAKATLQSVERLKSNEKTSTSYNNNSPLESMVVESASALKLSAQPSLQPVQKLPLPCGCQNEVCSSNHTCNHNNNKLPPPSSQQVQRNQLIETEKEREREKEKGEQPVVASSSVCSINVNTKHKLKKNKSVEKELFTHSDEAVQDESVGLTTPSTSKSTGTKRGRTADVHNLSERKRRDRINEKMKALQELIPNCNKVDKASMLDEAIEYLKSLQLQVQMMMMMGTGMCTPPFMLPPGLPHMPLAPYPHMAMGMGMSMGMCMGMGYGMGAGDINHPTVLHTMPTLPISTPLNFMPMINGGIFPLDTNGIPPGPSVGPPDDKRHVNPPNLAQSGVVGVNHTNK